MRNYFILFFIFTVCFFCAAQERSTKLVLFYQINETVPIDNFEKLDSLYNSGNLAGAELKITGYTDFLADAAYNKLLSEKRAEAVKSHLLKRTGANTFTISICKGEGEKDSRENGSIEGEAKDRRVVVSITFLATPVAKKPEKRKQNENEKQKDEGQRKEKQKTTTSISNNIKSMGKGQSLAIEGLSFIPGRHHVVPASEAVLKELLATMEENKQLKIEIHGHICCIGDGEEDGFDYDSGDNQLSVNRAKAVRDYLIKSGISATRLSYKGYGHSQPKVYPEDSPEAEQANRRVEIMIVE